MTSFGLSIILPTINEAANLEVLIPSLYEALSSYVDKLEVIVVDDGSTDNTREVLSVLSIKYQFVTGIFRSQAQKSLPQSIQAGIDSASGNLVAWMDADGSMSPSVLVELLQAWKNSEAPEKSVVVASRFVDGGRVKGAQRSGPFGLLQSAKNLKTTEDALVAVFLSWGLNECLYLLLGKCCRDLTSGFILGPKQMLKKFRLRGVYGDYFARLLYDIHKLEGVIIEIPYSIMSRESGRSKTGTTLLQVLKSGLPYVRLFAEPLKKRQNI